MNPTAKNRDKNDAPCCGYDQWRQELPSSLWKTVFCNPVGAMQKKKTTGVPSEIIPVGTVTSWIKILWWGTWGVEYQLIRGWHLTMLVTKSFWRVLGIRVSESCIFQHVSCCTKSRSCHEDLFRTVWWPPPLRFPWAASQEPKVSEPQSCDFWKLYFQWRNTIPKGCLEKRSMYDRIVWYDSWVCWQWDVQLVPHVKKHGNQKDWSTRPLNNGRLIINCNNDDRITTVKKQQQHSWQSKGTPQGHPPQEIRP